MASDDVGENGEQPFTSGGAENLFSFELVIDSITDLSVECHAPAVGFRLLDYPTVMIYHTQPERIDNLRKLCEISEKGRDSHDFENRDLFPNLKEEDGSFSFRKGKSTLFSMAFAKLCELLTKVPVSIILLDLFTAKPRIVGSCTMSLELAIEEIGQSVKFASKSVPTVTSRVFNLDVYNLMGTVIGHVLGKYTLYSYGTSLSKHVLRNESLRPFEIFLGEKRQSDTAVRTNPQFTPHESKSNRLLKKLATKEKGTNTSELQHFNLNLQEINKDLSNQNGIMLTKGPLEKSHEVIHSEKHKETQFFGNDLENGTCCPPPMIYCSEFSDGNVERIEDIELDEDSTKGQYSTQGKQGVPHWLKEAQSNHKKLEMQLLSNSALNESIERPDNFDEYPSNKKESKLIAIPDKADYGQGEIAVLLESLGNMPLLQGLVKEIVKLSRNSDQLMIEKKADEDTERYKNGPESILADRNVTDRLHGAKANLQNEGKKMKKNPKKSGKKLKFKTTKSHQLRHAMNSEKGSSALLSQGVRVKSDSKNAPTSRKGMKSKSENVAEPLQVADPGKTLDEKTEVSSHYGTNSVQVNHSDDADHHVDVTSLKSKSPVSLEIHLPSTFGSEESDHSFGVERKHSIGDIVGQSGIYTPPKLEKRWVGLDDLSQMKQSVNNIGNEATPSESEKSFKSLRSRASVNDVRHSGKTSRKSSPYYSDQFHSAEESNNGLDASQKSGVTRRPDSSALRAEHDKTTSSTTPSSAGSTRSAVSRAGRSFSSNGSSVRQSHGNDASTSIKSFTKRNTSDLSKPVASAYSPTTSRSLRTKPRLSHEANDEITHSVDMSDVSLRTDDTDRQNSFMAHDSQGDDISSKSRYSFAENKEVTDKFRDDSLMDTKSSEWFSPGEGDHRTPTPKHVILSQAKLGYTM